MSSVLLFQGFSFYKKPIPREVDAIIKMALVLELVETLPSSPANGLKRDRRPCGSGDVAWRTGRGSLPGAWVECQENLSVFWSVRAGQ